MKVFKDDIVYRQLDPSNEIYFLLKGQIYLTNSQGTILQEIKESFHFGEEEVIMQFLS